jgi:hypothetical protein
MFTLNSATKDIQTVALYKENEPGFLDIYPHHTTTTTATTTATQTKFG